MRYIDNGTLIATATSRQGSDVRIYEYNNPMVALWDAETGKLVRTLQHAGRLDAFDTDENTLLVSRYTVDTSDGRTYGYTLDLKREYIALWDAKIGKRIRTFPIDMWGIAPIAFCCPAHIVACASESGGIIRIYNSRNGKRVRDMHFPAETDPYISFPIYNVKSLAFSPDGKILAIGSYIKVCLYNTQTGQRLRTLRFDKSAFNPMSNPVLAFSPDGKQLAASGTQTKIWEVTTGQIARTLLVATAGVAWSPDGNTLATIDAPPTSGDLTNFDKTCALRLWRMR